ncbi:MAG: SAM-dependent methyltransferase [Hydrogenovibrio sp.]
MWNETYDTEHYVYGTEPNDFLREQAHHLPKGRVLCLAEGEGRNAVFLAKLGYDVTAVDLSPVGLQKAERLAAEHQVEIETVCADLAQFDLGEEVWDGIVSIFCHLPSDLRADLYHRVQTALKPNGVFLVEGYTPLQLSYKTGGPPVAEMMVSQQVLQQELPQMTFRHLSELERHVVEGTHHTGLGHVVQCIGVKMP